MGEFCKLCGDRFLYGPRSKPKEIFGQVICAACVIDFRRTHDRGAKLDEAVWTEFCVARLKGMMKAAMAGLPCVRCEVVFLSGQKHPKCGRPARHRRRGKCICVSHAGKLGAVGNGGLTFLSDLPELAIRDLWGEAP